MPSFLIEDFFCFEKIFGSLGGLGLDPNCGGGNSLGDAVVEADFGLRKVSAFAKSTSKNESVDLF